METQFVDINEGFRHKGSSVPRQVKRKLWTRRNGLSIWSWHFTKNVDTFRVPCLKTEKIGTLCFPSVCQYRFLSETRGGITYQPKIQFKYSGLLYLEAVRKSNF